MKIDNLMKVLQSLNITGLSDDTRYLEAGDLFICIKGKKYDGTKLIDEAVFLGAKAILTDQNIDRNDITIIKVNDLDSIFYDLIAHFYQYPWREMQMIGITGTDGKTTTASLIEYLLQSKYEVAYIGTNGIRYNDYISTTPYTTLPYCLFVKTIRKLALMGARFVCLEASSEGLINKRLYNIDFDVAIFTNLSHEHLDTHKTMNNYLKAKLILFSQLHRSGVAIVNKDSKYSKAINHSNIITYGLKSNADYQIKNISYQKKYTEFDLITPKFTCHNLKINLLETYNLYNALSAIIVALHYKVSIKQISNLILNMPKIEGRLEQISTNEPFKVYVDFAHTPNALKEVLETLRQRTTGKLIIVCGSAGNKDKSKRPLMGKIATELADYCIFTSEDPRNENPNNILESLTKKIKSQNYEKIINRPQAIKKAIDIAKPNDTVIITGKGAETYFDLGNEIISYSDITTIQKILADRTK